MGVQSKRFQVQALDAASLRAESADFDRFWRENEVVSHGEGLKRIHHPELGTVEMEFSAFAVDGRPELNLLVYNLTSPEAARRLREVVARRANRERAG